MGHSKRQKAYWDMTTAELAQATKEFEQEFVGDTFHAMTAADRTRWERVKRKRGRPREGHGVKVVSVSVEKGLLARSDALARKKGLTRAALVARALKTVLAAEGISV